MTEINEPKDIQVTIHSTAYYIDDLPDTECIFITAKWNSEANARDPFDYLNIAAGNPRKMSIKDVTHIFVLPDLNFQDIYQQFAFWKMIFYNINPLGKDEVFSSCFTKFI